MPYRIAPPLLLAVLYGCANPVAPTGGPPDATPPEIVASEPAMGAVNVTDRSVRLTFSEYIDQASFLSALTVTPEPDTPPRIRWRRRSVEITFDEPLRENTTYILTFDTNLRDYNRIALSTPLTLAFSTGPVINKGRLDGQVVDPLTGAGLGGVDVFAYVAPDAETAPDSLPPAPAYRTQTDDTGRFQFEYLSEQPYFVVALRDRNRSRAPESPEPVALPPRPALLADTARTPPGLPWILTAQDTVGPELQRIRPLADRRIALRFSEAVRLIDRTPGSWILEDSLSGQAVPIQAVYTTPDDPVQVYLHTDPLGPATHRIAPAGLVDSSGNAVSTRSAFFTPLTTPDTLQLRFQTFLPAGQTVTETGFYPLPPDTLPGLRLNQPPPDETLQSIVTLQDTTGRPLAFTTSTQNGTAYRIHPDPPLQPGQVVRMEVAGAPLSTPDTVYARTFQRLPDTELGELSGYVVAADATAAGTIVVDLLPAEDAVRPLQSTRPNAEGYFRFDRLPGGNPYRFRAYLDLDANQRWSSGQVQPYRPPEPMTWSADSLRVRAKWESELDDTLRIPTF